MENTIKVPPNGHHDSSSSSSGQPDSLDPFMASSTPLSKKSIGRPRASAYSAVKSSTTQDQEFIASMLDGNGTTKEQQEMYSSTETKVTASIGAPVTLDGSIDSSNVDGIITTMGLERVKRNVRKTGQVYYITPKSEESNRILQRSRYSDEVPSSLPVDTHLAEYRMAGATFSRSMIDTSLPDISDLGSQPQPITLPAPLPPARSRSSVKGLRPSATSAQGADVLDIVTMSLAESNVGGGDRAGKEVSFSRAYQDPQKTMSIETTSGTYQKNIAGGGGASSKGSISGIQQSRLPDVQIIAASDFGLVSDPASFDALAKKNSEDIDGDNHDQESRVKKSVSYWSRFRRVVAKSSRYYKSDSKEHAEESSETHASPDAGSPRESGLDGDKLHLWLVVSQGTKFGTRAKVEEILNSDIGNLDDLRILMWTGIPFRDRAICWKLLLGYLPSKKSRRDSIADRKLEEYQSMRNAHVALDAADQVLAHQTLAQIAKDLPRQLPGLPCLHGKQAQNVIRNVLFTWALRNPVTGYVQGMNDMVAPLLMLFGLDMLGILQDAVGESFEDALMSGLDSSGVENMEGVIFSTPEFGTALESYLESPQNRDQLQAACFWCFSAILDRVHDNYIVDQKGVQIRVAQIDTVLAACDKELSVFLLDMRQEGLETIQFAWKWIHSLFLRDFPLPVVIRFWDALFAEDTSEGVCSLIVYICAAVLSEFRSEILACGKSFDKALEFLTMDLYKQFYIPSQATKALEILATAYVFRSKFPGI